MKYTLSCRHCCLRRVLTCTVLVTLYMTLPVLSLRGAEASARVAPAAEATRRPVPTAAAATAGGGGGGVPVVIPAAAPRVPGGRRSAAGTDESRGEPVIEATPERARKAVEELRVAIDELDQAFRGLSSPRKKLKLGHGKKGDARSSQRGHTRR